MSFPPIYTWWKETDKLSFLVTIIFGFIGIYIAIVQLLPQLKELNAKANIAIYFHQATTTIQKGPSVAGPLDFLVVPRNNGNYTTSFWRILITFCNNIEVSKSDKNWIMLDPPSKQYIYQSSQLLISTQGIGYIFTDDLDSIGDFKIYFPSNEIGQDIPIAMVFSSGEKTEAKYTLVLLNKDGFIYKDINFDNKSHIIPLSTQSLVQSCRPIIYQN